MSASQMPLDSKQAHIKAATALQVTIQNPMRLGALQDALDILSTFSDRDINTPLPEDCKDHKLRGERLFEAAYYYGHVNNAVIRELLVRGAVPSLATPGHKSALTRVALHEEHLTILISELQNKYEAKSRVIEILNTPDGCGETVMTIAAAGLTKDNITIKQGSLKNVIALIAAGAEYKGNGHIKKSALWSALNRGQGEIAHHLIQAKELGIFEGLSLGDLGELLLKVRDCLKNSVDRKITDKNKELIERVKEQLLEKQKAKKVALKNVGNKKSYRAAAAAADADADDADCAESTSDSDAKPLKEVFSKKQNDAMAARDAQLALELSARLNNIPLRSVKSASLANEKRRVAAASHSASGSGAGCGSAAGAGGGVNVVNSSADVKKQIATAESSDTKTMRQLGRRVKTPAERERLKADDALARQLFRELNSLPQVHTAALHRTTKDSSAASAASVNTTGAAAASAALVNPVSLATVSAASAKLVSAAATTPLLSAAASAVSDPLTVSSKPDIKMQDEPKISSAELSLNAARLVADEELARYLDKASARPARKVSRVNATVANKPGLNPAVSASLTGMTTDSSAKAPHTPSRALTIPRRAMLTQVANPAARVAPTPVPATVPLYVRTVAEIRPLSDNNSKVVLAQKRFMARYKADQARMKRLNKKKSNTEAEIVDPITVTATALFGQPVTVGVYAKPVHSGSPQAHDVVAVGRVSSDGSSSDQSSDESPTKRFRRHERVSVQDPSGNGSGAVPSVTAASASAVNSAPLRQTFSALALARLAGLSEVVSKYQTKKRTFAAMKSAATSGLPRSAAADTSIATASGASGLSVLAKASGAVSQDLKATTANTALLSSGGNQSPTHLLNLSDGNAFRLFVFARNQLSQASRVEAPQAELKSQDAAQKKMG